MSLRSTTEAWGALARVFHWGMFVLFAGLIGVGYYMVDLPLSAAKMKIYALHKSVGVVMLVLVVLRLFWRTIDRRPASEPMSVWQHYAAVVAVVALYALMLVLPLSGWAYNSAAGFPLRWFNLANLPALMAPAPALKAWAKSAHEMAAVVFMSVIGVHALAALKHHFWDKDRTLLRMLPWRKGTH
jgi:cytochrome b561